jgi:drug/metabolite transporter (DMT)-like permease
MTDLLDQQVTSPVATKQQPLMAASAAVIAWGLGPLFVRGIGASTPTIVAYRLAMAVPVMIGLAYLTGGRISRPLMRQALVPSMVFFASMVTGFAAFKHTTIVNATLIPALQPVLLVAIASRFLGERRSRREVLWGVAALGGVLIVISGSQGGDHSLWGDFLAVLNLGIWTTYFLRSKRIRDAGVHSWSFLACVFTWSALFAVPWALATSPDLGAIRGMDWLYLAGMVVGPGVVGHGLMTWAQRYLDVSLASLLMLGNPVVSIVGAWMVFGQRLSAFQGLGALVVLIGLGGVVASQRTVVEPVVLEPALVASLPA